MSDFVIGFITGIPIGTAVGIAVEITFGINQKPWTDLTEEEKKLRKNAVILGMIALLLGVIMFALLMLT